MNLSKYWLYIFSLTLCVLMGFLMAFGSEILQNGSVSVASGGLSVSGNYLYDGTHYYTGPLNQIATLPAASYSWINQGSATETASGNSLILHSPASGSGGNPDWNLRITPISATTTLTVAMMCDVTFTNAQAAMCGVGFYESATTKLEVVTVYGGNGGSIMQVNQYGSPTTFSSNVYNGNCLGIGNPLWLRLTISGGNLTLTYSFDGVNFPSGYTEAVNHFFTTAPDNWFYAGNSQGTIDVYNTLLSWNAH
jgi:hypothetical protein